MSFRRMLKGASGRSLASKEPEPGDQSTEITVHPETRNPTRVWDTIRYKQKVDVVKPIDPATPKPRDHVRFVCISDTHSKTGAMPEIPEGDVLIHAGDFTKISRRKEVVNFNEFLGHTRFVCTSDTFSKTTYLSKVVPPGDVFIHAGSFNNVGLPREVTAFNEFLGTLPHRHKIVIAGNHELTFDQQLMSERNSHVFMSFASAFEGLKKNEWKEIRSLLTNCTYLEDSQTHVMGFKIYGSPWQPVFCDWGFNLPRGQALLDKWNKIPEDTDILITHGPPLGHGDLASNGCRAGCVELLSTVQRRVRPKYHVFGHIHEGYGVTTDGQTTFVNAAICDVHYRPCNPPIVFDLPTPRVPTVEAESSV
ncbi:metallophosphoesterase MPPED2-like isoform X2 [Lytechinus variegatus]|uniref:metallophosphoesterase MPPED2-like isoform X2 n=1 Tax=Lytechinus variegatus TaxID=7654 RepID=UPI001BB1910D|nr:metallophosphoesterase MPPED2-like isoform X2 [Lytechinus variegatus]